VPQLLAYNVDFNDDETQWSVLHIDPNSASLELQMKVAGPKFPTIGEFIRLLSIDVYGRLDEVLVAGLRQKARMLGTGTVRVHDLRAGFARWPNAQVQWRRGMRRSAKLPSLRHWATAADTVIVLHHHAAAAIPDVNVAPNW
jgi:hypothetical protein